MHDENSIKALVSLIDDPDEQIFAHVRKELLLSGPPVLPYLENLLQEHQFDVIFHQRLEKIIHEIHYDNIKSSLHTWINSTEKDLLQAALIIAKYQYPFLDEAEVMETIQQIRKDVWLELNGKQTAFEQIKIFNRIFFGNHQFQGDTKHFHSPLNSYVNTVIETRKGNPLSLSLIYSIVAQSLDLPVYGVNLPNHFILAYMDENGAGYFLPEKSPYGVLFYINPFSGGSFIHENAIKSFLNNLELPHSREYFEPCSNSAIIARMLSNLIAAFEQVGNETKVNELTALRELFA
jgi:regulator of sirC expression with transglutaminase-like and TPR domain